MKQTDFDVIVIGGGPAGAVSATYLSRFGFRTAVIERKKYPRETLCGEFLSPEVFGHLRNLNLENKFLDLKPNRITSFRFISGDRTYSSNLPFESFAVKRSILDEFLLNEAVSSGSNLFQPAAAEEIINEGRRFLVRISFRNETRELSSKFLIGAYGKYSVLDKKLHRNFIKKTTGYYGIKFHICESKLKNIDDSCIYLFRGDNIYTGINSVGGGVATVCFLVRKQDSKRTPSDHLAFLFKENKQLSDIFYNKTPDLRLQEIFGAGNIFFGRKELVQNGVILIGDAAGIIAPLAGDGIGMAFLSARTAAEIINEAGEKNLSHNEIDEIYKIKWRQMFSKRTITASVVQSIILRNSYFNLIPGRLIKHFIPTLITATRN